MWTSIRRAAVVTAALCTVAGGTSAAAHADEPGRSEPAPAGLQRFYDQRLAWGPCDAFAASPQEKMLYADPQVSCATLEVPLDYAAPQGRTAQIAVLRYATTGPRAASLVVNPGGPGASGIQAAAEKGPQLSGGPFDIVGFDPRGVGASTPKLDCVTPEEVAAARTAPAATAPLTDVAGIENGIRALIAQCVERSGGLDVLANAGTRDVARDLDMLRAALGDRRLTYLGYSYGTAIGSTYAEMFPGNVRAMVLDGAIDPNESSESEALTQRAGFQDAFEAYAADCARLPDCPLGTGPTGATAAFQALARPLLTTPAPAGTGRTLSFDDAVTATNNALYSPDTWPALTAGLTELKVAGTGVELVALADAYAAAADGDANLIIGCVDDERITDRDQAVAFEERLRAVAPFRDPGTPVVAALDACGLWPVPPTSSRHVPNVDGLPTVLVVSTTGDPSTPHAGGVALADGLNARLLTVEGTQHTAFAQGNTCVDEIGVRYLETLALPAEGARCAAAAPA